MPNSEDKLIHEFVRNKWFPKKLVTSSDFTIEQEYFNKKRWLIINSFMDQVSFAGWT